MKYFPEIFAAEDGQCDVTNAFSFSKDTVFLLINANSEAQDLYASALVKVDLFENTAAYSVLHEFNSGSLDYHSEHPNLHYILASGGYIHHIENDAMTLHLFSSDKYQFKLARIDDRAIMVFGEEGLAHRFENGIYTLIPTPTRETLHAMHFVRPDFAYAVGNYGTFLQFNGLRFAQIEHDGSEPLRTVHVKSDGSVLLAGKGGNAMVATGDELIRIEGSSADFCSVVEFKGVEYWGDDDFGIYIRLGTEFRPKFNTSYAFNMNVVNGLMTINAGYSVYLFDGKDWLQLTLNSDVNNLIERVPLDFDPL
jgi:hypothetical protein